MCFRDSTMDSDLVGLKNLAILRPINGLLRGDRYDIDLHKMKHLLASDGTTYENLVLITKTHPYSIHVQLYGAARCLYFCIS